MTARNARCNYRYCWWHDRENATLNGICITFNLHHHFLYNTNITRINKVYLLCDFGIPNEV